MTPTPPASTAALWARFRFSVVGALLSAPPPRGALKIAIRSLAAKTWTHPTTGRDVQFSAVTIERWYYTARRARRRPRCRLAPRRAQGLRQGVPGHGPGRAALVSSTTTTRTGATNSTTTTSPRWSKAEPALGPLRSYATVRRYMKAHGWVPRPRPHPKQRPGEERAEIRRQTREVRSYEAAYVGSLWHLDFHHGSLKVLTPGGQWLRPIALGILDDHSRLCCHVQWYLSETAEDLVHGLSQAIQKRGLPRALLTDNGPAMVADEVTEGLLRLGIVHERTLPYSPYQNGKQESFWGTLEGRLMTMLEGVAELTLALLNEATQAWMEIEYNRAVHRETSSTPVERFAQAPDVLRTSPSSESLRDAFRLETQQDAASERWHDLARGRALRDPGTVSSLPRTDRALCALEPGPGRPGRPPQRDHSRSHLSARQKRQRRRPPRRCRARRTATCRQKSRPGKDGAMPPLLKQILQEYSATGLPPAYLPKTPPSPTGDAS